MGREGGTGEKAPCPNGNEAGKRFMSEERRSAEGRPKHVSLHRNSKKPYDGAEEEAEVMLWSNHARDLVANLARVFKKEGAEEATRRPAAAIVRRIEVKTRCCAVLRVSLQDTIEDKVGEILNIRTSIFLPL